MTNTSMSWRSYLRVQTRRPEFLWRMVVWILAMGIGVGFAAQSFWKPTSGDASEARRNNRGWEQLEELAEQGAWTDVWWRVPQEIYSRYEDRGPVVLAILSGCCWMAFLLQALQVGCWRDGRLWWALVGVALGVLSIWPTGFFIVWQEIGWGLRDSAELVPGIRYNVLGVGLREEFAKLCCLLPLLPILLRWRSELAALLVSSCVGVGFAVEENVGYFSANSASTLGRFLTANPAHIAFTGLIGLNLYRACRSPKEWGSQALGMFGMMVFAHGLYDAFLSVPALAEYAMVATILFALVIYQFFHELRTLRNSQGDTISLSANFLCGVSLLTAATFVYLSATVGTSIAFDMLANGVIGLAVMVYLFLREMPETLVSV